MNKTIVTILLIFLVSCGESYECVKVPDADCTMEICATESGDSGYYLVNGKKFKFKNENEIISKLIEASAVCTEESESTGIFSSSDSKEKRDADTSQKSVNEHQNKKSAKTKPEKIKDLQWSNQAKKIMNLENAIEYCEKLSEDGHSDWRLPNIDELRTLVQNSSTIQTGGSCEISEKAGKLAYSDMNVSSCWGKNGSNFSKLGDDTILWSSSICSDDPMLAWIVNFIYGRINAIPKSIKSNVRCVREESESTGFFSRIINFVKGVFSSSDSKEKMDADTSQEAVQNTRIKNQTDKQKEKSNTSKSAVPTNKNESIETEKLQWSKMSKEEMSYAQAENYCNNLIEDNHNDWRLPDIDEVKILSSWCSKLKNGQCKISKECLSFSCLGFSSLNDMIKNEFKSSKNNCDCFEGEDKQLIDDHIVNRLAEESGVTPEEIRKMEMKKGDFDTQELIAGLKITEHAEEIAKEIALPIWSSSSVLDIPLKDAMDDQKYFDVPLKDIENSKWISLFFIPSFGQKYHVKCVRGKPAATQKSNVNAKNQTDKQKEESNTDISESANLNNKNESPQTENMQWSEKAAEKMFARDAVDYCENLSESGHDDWRLPTISELRSLIQNCEETKIGGSCGVADNCLSQNDCQNKACDGCKDKTVQYSKLGDEGFFWSSSFRSESSDNAWYVDFTYASIHSHSDSKKSIRCVRGRNSITQSSETIKPVAKEQIPATSKLQWAKRAAKPLNWNQAIDYCENLSESGHSDWRLPSIDELKNAKMGSYDENEEDIHLWSSSETNQGNDSVWVIDPNNEAVSEGKQTDAYCRHGYCYHNTVRCVRDENNQTVIEKSDESANIKDKADTTVGSKLSTVKIKTVEVNGSIDYATSVSNTIKGSNAAVKRCYDKALSVNPTLEGKVSITILINEKGRPESINIAEDTLKNAEIIMCIKGIIGRLRFPKPENSSAKITLLVEFTNI